jgi:phosphohistidine phosphatase
MNLYLMRHAIAVEPDGFFEDSERPLSEKGRKRMGKVARNLSKLDLSFDLIMTSPFLCARQTADLVADAFGVKSKYVVESENLCPLGSTYRLVEEINARGAVDFLLLVGHEPFLNQLIGMLIAGDASVTIGMRYAGLCKLSIDHLIYGRCATLEWLMTPSQLVAL